VTPLRRTLGLLAAFAAVCGIMLAAVPGPARAERIVTVRTTPSCIEATAKIVVSPGGDGSAYSAEKGGVYAFTVTVKKTFRATVKGGKRRTYKGDIYVGSTNSLKRRRGEWRRWWKMEVRTRSGWRDSTFTWHVLVRDWSDDLNGKIPHGRTKEDVRLAAEQLAITHAHTWGATHGYFPLNRNLNVLRKFARTVRTQLLGIADMLYLNQLENNAGPPTAAQVSDGTAARDAGDELNMQIESGTAPSIENAMPLGFRSGVPGYGAGATKCR
jgi:hypothetical protein